MLRWTFFHAMPWIWNNGDVVGNGIQRPGSLISPLQTPTVAPCIVIWSYDKVQHTRSTNSEYFDDVSYAMVYFWDVDFELLFFRIQQIPPSFPPSWQPPSCQLHVCSHWLFHFHSHAKEVWWMSNHTIKMWFLSPVDRSHLFHQYDIVKYYKYT